MRDQTAFWILLMPQGTEWYASGDTDPHAARGAGKLSQGTAPGHSEDCRVGSLPARRPLSQCQGPSSDITSLTLPMRPSLRCCPRSSRPLFIRVSITL